MKLDYGLVTAIGDSLCGLIVNVDLPNDRFLQRHITAHVEALKAVQQFDLRGDGGGEGKRLLTTLRVEDSQRPSR